MHELMTGPMHELCRVVLSTFSSNLVVLPTN